jgi:hypothetical protein
VQFRIVFHAAAEDGFAAGKAQIGEFLAEGEAIAGFAVSGGQGTQLELGIHRVGKDNRPALRFQHGDGIIQNGVEKFFFAFDIDQMLPGPEQGE